MAKVNIDLIEQIRKKSGLTQSALAKKIGVSRYLYSLLKHGKRRFSVDHIEAIWRELQIPLHKLIIKEK